MAKKLNKKNIRGAAVFLLGGVIFYFFFKNRLDIKIFEYLKSFLIFLLGGFTFLGLYLSSKLAGSSSFHFGHYIDFGNKEDIKASLPSSWKSLLSLFIVLLIGFSIVFVVAFLFLGK